MKVDQITHSRDIYSKFPKMVACDLLGFGSAIVWQSRDVIGHVTVRFPIGLSLLMVVVL